MPSLEIQIVGIFEEQLLSIRLVSEGDLYETIRRNVLIKQNQPIEFLLPAFPCKSPNLDKVTGKLPDAGELYALQHLNNICRQVSFLYQPGCHIRIWFDGRVFGDLIGGRYCKI